MNLDRLDGIFDLMKPPLRAPRRRIAVCLGEHCIRRSLTYHTYYETLLDTVLRLRRCKTRNRIPGGVFRGQPFAADAATVDSCPSRESRLYWTILIMTGIEALSILFKANRLRGPPLCPHS
jgi:hypothetical protein